MRPFAQNFDDLSSKLDRFSRSAPVQMSRNGSSERSHQSVCIEFPVASNSLNHSLEVGNDEVDIDRNIRGFVLRRAKGPLSFEGFSNGPTARNNVPRRQIQHEGTDRPQVRRSITSLGLYLGWSNQNQAATQMTARRIAMLVGAQQKMIPGQAPGAFPVLALKERVRMYRFDPDAACLRGFRLE